MPSKLYFTDEFSGKPVADGEEMQGARWMSLQELKEEQLFPPFEESIKILLELLTGKEPGATIITAIDGGHGSGNFGHGGRPGQLGGSSENAAPNVDFKAAREYTKAIKGTKTVKGTMMKRVSGHAAYRMKERGFSVDDVKDALTGAGITYPGNKKNPDAECYQHKGVRMVVSPDGVLVSAIVLGGEK